MIQKSLVVKLSWFDHVFLSPSYETIHWWLNLRLESVCLGGMSSWGKSFVQKHSNSSSSCDAECYLQLSSFFSLCFHGVVPCRQQSLWQKGDKGLKTSFKDVLSVHVPLVEHRNKGRIFIFWLHRVTSPGISKVLVLLPGGEKAMSILALVKKLLILEMNFVARHCPESRAPRTKYGAVSGGVWICKDPAHWL